ncbi:F-box/kelch-repeat protein At3g06240-like [Carya illinoinensis]|uniref:F-box/kelch-repeat protein At3g06240-like n=1 Tax=Carya illinoinensis TaxID=32201 RepID=UPI001C722187|nr:F-box/kelch-repeat protein At3g06240-like [Carya illinoinensis]
MKEEAMSRKFLPEEVVVEILLRLPVKSLVRFRCVSKRWLSLISDPRLAKSQFKRAADHIQRLLFPTPFGLGSLEVDAPFGDGSALRELFVPFKQPDLRLNLLGSCDGLVFASHYDHKDFYIWNPSTGEHRKLPDPGISPHPDNEYMYGFGYDSSIDDYKVIVIAFLPPRPCPGYVGALCGGAVHWLGGVFRPGPNLAILAFDLAEEKFRQVPMPPNA